MKKKLIALILSLVCSANGQAAVGCTGNVTSLIIGPSGGLVEVGIGYGVWYLCSVSTVINNIPTESCKTMYSTLLAAKVSGRTITMYFDTTNQCTQIGSWAAPNPVPYYFEINN